MENLQAIRAYQGQMFKVTLESQLGSTNYGWCLESLPEGVVLVSQEDLPIPGRFCGVHQVFYFIPISGDKMEVELNFVLLCLSDPLRQYESSKKVKINVIVIPANENTDAEQFVQYSENAAFYGNNAGFVDPAAGSCACTNVKYGFPLILKYGYPTDPCVKYGYPADPCVAYGYPADSCVKYGYPENPCVKYGYPACEKYGYPSKDECC